MSEIVRFTIDTPPRTKKNHQQIRFNKKTGRRFVSQSDAYKAFQAAAMMLIPEEARLGIDSPVNVQALYYMPTRRVVDLVNLHEALHDVLKDAGVVADDNSRIIAATDGSRVLYDKERPRTEVIITSMGDEKGGTIQN